MRDRPGRAEARPPRRILVTGGAGFIGSHLCASLVAAGHDVTCLDNFLTGDMARVAALSASGRFRVVRANVAEPFDADVDDIYNLACPASPVQYQTDPIETTRISVLGALNVLDLAIRSGARVLQASTSEVYGDPDIHPQPETYWGSVNPIGPRACYDEGKRCAESLFFDYRRMKGARIRVARIFNTYGPHMSTDDGRVIPSFIAAALAQRDLTVQGDGAQTRSFCYVTDLVDGLIRLMNADDAVTGPVNLGNPQEITIRALAETIVAACGSSSRIIAAPAAADDPRRRRPDISLAARLLQWAPAVSLDDGLAQTIAWFRGATEPAAPAVTVLQQFEGTPKV